ncbi:energy-coupling factor transporter transmembrane component T family protein [Candidatus Formimonas warabiya]|uniref:Energy-coupling factor transporter transmembrane protein EcfT n=1 Tax=Formimonas warabiya TaxID=1761012 RepID=A0A3G1KTW7_FORW1|nr:energy-coupling factor transporter transmembrane component T [Candidatus Formimonas warabiya]ATW25854.1 hypothetical protein DCMF_14725 [Candidatus Formimonas warabiya]
MKETIFSYNLKRSFLHGIDPISKLIWLVIIGILAMVFQTPFIQIALFLLLMGTATILAKVPFLSVFVKLKPIWILALIILVIQSIVIQGDHLLVKIGPITVYLEGMMVAVSVGLRMVNIALGSVIFLFSTHPRDLAISVHEKLGLPVRGTQAFFLALRFLPLLQDEYEDLVAAQKIRGAGGSKSLTEKFSRLKRFTVPFLFCGLRRAQITAMAMDSKAFGANPNKRYYHEVNYPLSGKIFVLGWIIIIGIFYYLVSNGYVQNIEQLRFACDYYRCPV